MNLHRLTAVASCYSGFARAAAWHHALTSTLTNGELQRNQNFTSIPKVYVLPGAGLNFFTDPDLKP